MLRRKIVTFVKEIAGRYGMFSVARSAAALSYYLILSAFPMAILLNSFLGLLNVDQADFLSSAWGILPERIIDFIYTYILSIRSGRSIVLNFTAAYVMLSSLSGAVRVYRRTSAQILRQKPARGVGAWLVSLLAAFGMLLVLFLSCVLMACGAWLFNLLTGEAGGGFYGAWNLARFTIMLLALYFAFCAVYRLSGPKGYGVRTGAAFASLVLVLSGPLFSRLVSLSMKYELIYGSLASVVILLIWLNLFGNILFVGSILNKLLWEKEAKNRRN